MAGPKSTQTRFVGTITYTIIIHPYTCLCAFILTEDKHLMVLWSYRICVEIFAG